MENVRDLLKIATPIQKDIEKILDYFKYHSKNLTNSQYLKIEDLEDVYEKYSSMIKEIEDYLNCF